MNNGIAFSHGKDLTRVDTEDIQHSESTRCDHLPTEV